MFSFNEIKKAFWKTFHKSGEWFFGYREGDDDRNNFDTEDSWKDFVDELIKIVEESDKRV